MTSTFHPGFHLTPANGTEYAQRTLTKWPPGSPARLQLLRDALREATAPERDALEESSPPETWRAYWRAVLAALVEGMTLTEVLAALGLSHATAASGRHGHLAVLNDRGACLFSGTDAETWPWLRRTGRLPEGVGGESRVTLVGGATWQRGADGQWALVEAEVAA